MAGSTITVRGKEFSNADAVAKHFGVTAHHVRRMRRVGRLDQIQLDPNKPKGGRPPRPDLRMTFLIRGEYYESAEAVCKRFKLRSPSNVYRLVALGRADRIGLGRKCSRAGNGRGKPITIGRLSFSSMQEASTYFGFEKNYISRAKRGKNFCSMAVVLRRALEMEARIEQEARQERERQYVEAA